MLCGVLDYQFSHIITFLFLSNELLVLLSIDNLSFIALQDSISH